MPQLRESATAVLVRGETVTAGFASEPYEAGWAIEAVLFLRLMGDPDPRAHGQARIEISPDGMNWVAEGTTVPLPKGDEAVTFARIAHFGNWLRITVELPEAMSVKLLATLHLKG